MIGTRNTREQFDRLFLKPLSQIRTDRKETPIVVIIDALDECERESDIQLLVRLFFRAKAELPSSVKLFLTSRPELPLRLEFGKGVHQDVILHNMPLPLIERDISVFLEHRLRNIRMNFNASVAGTQRLYADWPSQSAIQSLSTMSAPLFIFAATVCLFIADRKSGNPEKQLAKVLRHQANSRQASLSGTYLLVLASRPPVSTREKKTIYFKSFVRSWAQLFSWLARYQQNRFHNCLTSLRKPSTIA